VAVISCEFPVAWNSAVADQYRDRLVALYGKERGQAVKYAEGFQISRYGRQATVEELKRMFPTLH
jgi:hypothetical protein